MNAGLTLSFLSLAMSFIGCLIIYVDEIIRWISPGSSFSIANSKLFLVASLSVSAGSLTFTSLARVLPHADLMLSPKGFEPALTACFISGAAAILALDAIIRRFALESIVHCEHQDPESISSENSVTTAENIDSISKLLSSEPDYGSIAMDGSAPITTTAVPVEPRLNLVAIPSGEPDPITSGIPYDALQSHKALQILKGQGNVVAYLHGDLENVVIEGSLDRHINHHSDHRHENVETLVLRMLLLGLQTVLAILLHKFPEGYIYYATLQIDRSLLVKIFLLLAVHNIAEGVSMTVPLYVSMGLRWKAIAIGGVLGGGAQPLGALIAMLTVPQEADKERLEVIFGCVMAAVSGFLAVIGVQMVVSARGFVGVGDRCVVGWFLAGMVVISLSSLL